MEDKYKATKKAAKDGLDAAKKKLQETKDKIENSVAVKKAKKLKKQLLSKHRVNDFQNKM